MEGAQQHRILIVGSDERVLSVIGNFLVSDGFDVTTACGTEAALHSLQFDEYDLLLLEDHFADLTSSCFLKRMLRIPRKAPVIILEGSPSRPCGLAPYNPFQASRFVNMRRPCEILEAAREVLSADPFEGADQSG